MRRKAIRDTNERWFGARSAGLQSASKSAGCSVVRISNAVEEGWVEYVAVPEFTASSSHSVERPVIGSKRNTSVSSGPMSQKHFDVVSPVTSPRKSYVGDRNFGAALNREASGSRRRGERDRWAHHIFAFAKKK